ncbi:hypothetical protein TeGR_g10859, partial [Tetraparma gracilis]
YIDLFSFHGLSTKKLMDYVLREGGNMTVAEELKAEGKIKHIGFSTHGTPRVIRELILSDKFAYANIHYHFFGSYHAAGNDDGTGQEGNLGNLKLCLEKDMGVFIISPFDKGGMLYKPSEEMCQLTGPNLPPLIFAALHLWNVGAHTISVGIAKPSDFDEVLHAASIMDDENTQSLVRRAERNLNKQCVRERGGG